MSSHPKGIREFAAGGTNYKMQFTINTLCDLEAAFNGKDIAVIAEELQLSPSVTITRKLFMYSLREHHPSITEKDAGNIMGDIGMASIGGMLVSAISDAFGVDPAQAEKKAKEELAPLV